MTEKKKKPSVWRNYFSMLFKSKLPWVFIIVCFGLSLFEAQAKLWLSDQISIIASDYAVIADAIAPLTIALLLGLGSVIVGVVNQYLQNLLGAKIEKNVQLYAVEKVFYLKVKDLEEKDSREFISRLTDDTSKNTTFCVNLFVNEIPRLYFLVSYIIKIAAYKQPSLLISSLAMIPIIFILAVISGKVYFKSKNNIQEKIAHVTAKLSEKIENMEVIKNYNNEEKEIESGLKIIDELDKVKRQGTWADRINEFMLHVSFAIPFILMVAPPAILKFQGVFNNGSFLDYLMTVVYWRNYLEEHIALWTDMKSAQGATYRLSEVLELENEMTVVSDKKPQVGNIQFNNVSFAYGDHQVLDNVSFTIEKGKKTALVGLSGSGKTTVLNLIEKFYQPTQGTITLNGEDIQQYDYAAYRALFAYLPQNAPAFSGTIRQMMNYTADEDYSDQQLLEVLKKIRLDQDIVKLGGLDYQIGDNGEKLSGGQRQKLGIGRLLMSKREIILLDEATSALDAEATAALQQEIDKATQGKTQIVVSHDLSTISNADKILVFENGKLAAEGKHQDLLQLCPAYQRLVKEVA